MKEKGSIQKLWEKRKNIIITGAVIIVVGTIMIYNTKNNAKSTYTVMNGYVEKVSDVVGILVKSEKLLSLNQNTSAIPLIEQGKRVAKDEIIAMYKNEKYEQYLKQIENMDDSIQTLVKDLPATYSADISNIESQISDLTKEAKNTNSYVKMQEYKNKIDELSYKKVVILGQLSPNGSKIRELIEQRENMEITSKNASDNIKSPVSGVVTYKVDKLENIVDPTKILSYTNQNFDELFQKYSNNNVNEFGIKVIDNFLAYFVTKVPKGENDIYMKENKIYDIMTTEKDPDIFRGKLLKKIDNNDSYYVIFQIDNGIENVIDNRTIDLEIIWNKTEGWAVLKDAVKRNAEDTYDYVTLINGGEYINIPVKIKSKSDSVYIVDNLTDEEKKALNIQGNVKLSLYDILLIE